MHGAIFLFLKTEGAVQDRLGKWVWHTWGLFLVLYLLTTIYTLVAVLVSILAIANIPRALFARKFGHAFLSSSLTIAALVFLFALAVFPNIVAASNDPAHSWTVYNAASSEMTLGIGLLIVVIGLPFILTYTAVIYWTFRGKVVLGEHSY
jgi:cytochrome d ubiquinol oxidase subunit II